MKRLDKKMIAIEARSEKIARAYLDNNSESKRQRDMHLETLAKLLRTVDSLRTVAVGIRQCGQFDFYYPKWTRKSSAASIEIAISIVGKIFPRRVIAVINKFHFDLSWNATGRILDVSGTRAKQIVYRGSRIIMLEAYKINSEMHNDFMDAQRFMSRSGFVIPNMTSSEGSE
jgi:hypothetical protein